VFEQNRVAEHDVRRGESRDLVIGKVPGHDSDEHPDRLSAHNRFAAAGDVQLLLRQERRTVLGVVLVDGGDQGDLPLRLADRFPHLQGQDLGEFVRALAVELCHPIQQVSALSQRDTPPLAVGAVRARQGVRHLPVDHHRKLLDEFSGRRVDGAIAGHVDPRFRAPGRLRCHPSIAGSDAGPIRALDTDNAGE
jgi:hypothetical protein